MCSKNQLKYMIIVITLIMFLLAGCWNYHEIENLAIVLGAAVDYEKESDCVILALEIASAKGSGAEAETDSEIIESKGNTFFEASRNALAMTGRPLFWSHTKVLIISEELANERKKLFGVVDFFIRFPEARGDTFVLISMEETASEILEDINTNIEETKAIYLSKILFSQDKSTRYFSMPLWKFRDDWQTEGLSPVIPGVRLKPGKGRTLSEVYGTAVFKNEKLIGWLNGIETEGFLFAADQIELGVISTTTRENGFEHENDVTFQIIRSQTEVNPIYDKNQFTMEISVDLAVNLLEYGDWIEAIPEEDRMKIQAYLAALIKHRVEDVIEKAQKEFGADIFGFGQQVEKKYPDLWEQKSSDWEEEFTTIAAKVEVEVNMQISGQH